MGPPWPLGHRGGGGGGSGGGRERSGGACAAEARRQQARRRGGCVRCGRRRWAPLRLLLRLRGLQRSLRDGLRLALPLDGAAPARPSSRASSSARLVGKAASAPPMPRSSARSVGALVGSDSAPITRQASSTSRSVARTRQPGGAPPPLGTSAASKLAQANRCRLVRVVYPIISSAISVGLCTARRPNESGASSTTASWFATYQALSRDSSSEKAGPRASAHSSRPTTVPADTPAPTCAAASRHSSGSSSRSASSATACACAAGMSAAVPELPKVVAAGRQDQAVRVEGAAADQDGHVGGVVRLLVQQRGQVGGQRAGRRAASTVVVSISGCAVGGVSGREWQAQIQHRKGTFGTAQSMLVTAPSLATRLKTVARAAAAELHRAPRPRHRMPPLRGQLQLAGAAADIRAVQRPRAVGPRLSGSERTAVRGEAPGNAPSREEARDSSTAAAHPTDSRLTSQERAAGIPLRLPVLPWRTACSDHAASTGADFTLSVPHDPLLPLGPSAASKLAQANRCRLVRSVYPIISSPISLGLCAARRSNESGASSTTASWFATYQALSRDSSSEKAGPRASAHSSRPTTVPTDTAAPTCAAASRHSSGSSSRSASSATACACAAGMSAAVPVYTKRSTTAKASGSASGRLSCRALPSAKLPPKSGRK
ncbi:hypothetical protein TSOC_012986 [Tetrabaena socialis]|uniref:Uncharacterized protein n=1 Tax=Tetrabaena socialis TaxID=47790 RepID=A0A2J7ZLK1_9CHLO|nr:hypothetical protein TSOC_012986 [Tetrabaena socialis]|eukprot:PNH01142.1 hypothetical protein TSOC_012986 [Tetrabaena socialis]